MQILEKAFLVYTYMMVRRYRENYESQAIIVHVNQSGHTRLYYIIAITPGAPLETRLSVC